MIIIESVSKNNENENNHQAAIINFLFPTDIIRMNRVFFVITEASG